MDAELGKLEIVSSMLSLAEVCWGPERSGAPFNLFRESLDRSYFELVPVNFVVGNAARVLMTEGYAGLKPPDAIHLATALVHGASELHTYDRKLLNLSGKIPQAADGYLKICQPIMGH